MFRGIEKIMMQKLILPSFYRTLRVALLLFLLLSFLTGFLYPLLVMGVSQILFANKANGSLIVQDEHIVGSELLGQAFDDLKYFWGRPSGTIPFPYNTEASRGSNLGPSNRLLLTKMQDRIKMLHKNDPGNTQPIPIELITMSASGLDPHITPKAAFYQISRISRVRRLSESNLKDLIIRFTEQPQFGFLGEPRINVLKLNLELDRMKRARSLE